MAACRVVQCKLGPIECSHIQPRVSASDHMLCCSCGGGLRQQGYVQAGLHPLACQPSVLTGRHRQLSLDPSFTEQSRELLRTGEPKTQLSMPTCQHRLPACKLVQASQNRSQLMHCPPQLQRNLETLKLGRNEVDKWHERAQPAASGAQTVQSGPPRW